VAEFLVGGCVGVPFGVAALRVADAGVMKAVLGALLIVYACSMLSLRRLPLVEWGGRAADATVGFGGGTLGGLAGLAGPLPTVWTGLRGWSSLERRGAYQPFNLLILCVALAAYAGQSFLTADIRTYAAACVPMTIVGAFLGLRTYGKLDEIQFQRVVLCLLLISGVALVASNLL
jgi:uncharacterized membrane protein YfcA